MHREEMGSLSAAVSLDAAAWLRYTSYFGNLRSANR